MHPTNHGALSALTRQQASPSPVPVGSPQEGPPPAAVVAQAELPFPPEIVAYIMEIYLYNPADFQSSLQWEDVAGNVMDIVPLQKEFVVRFFYVNWAFYATASCVLRRYIILTSQDDIDTVGNAICHSFGLSSVDIGAWAWRLDLRIHQSYTPSSLNTLFQSVPNLKVLVIHNDSLGRASQDRFRPDSIVHSIGHHCKSLTRVQFESVGEEPTVRMLKELLVDLPFLRTLHIDTAYSPAQGDDDNGSPITICHHELSTLSIGSIRRRYHTVTGLDRVGVFLTSCIPNLVLPKLRTLHLQKAVPSMIPFLEAYGGQLVELGIGAGEVAFEAGYKWEDPETWQPHVTSYCPNLLVLVLVATEWPIHAPVRALSAHATIQNVAVVYVPPYGTLNEGIEIVLHAVQVIEEAPLTALRRVTLVTLWPPTMVSSVPLWENTRHALENRGVTVDNVLLREEVNL